MAARVRCAGRNVCLAEHPTPKLVTGNLDNFSNRGDSHRLSTPSTPLDKATLTLSDAPALPCSEVIEVTKVIGYRSLRSSGRPLSSPPGEYPVQRSYDIIAT